MTANYQLLAGTLRAPWQLAAPWGGQGYLSALDDWTHWVDFGTAGGGPPLVFVHGLGGSHLNWAAVGPDLAMNRRAIALDLRGFGLTPGDRHSATIGGNLALLNRFIAEVAGGPVILVGNSMGGMLSILQAHAHPETVAGLVLIAPVLPARPQRPDWRVASQFWLSALPGLRAAYQGARGNNVPPRLLARRVMNLMLADPAHPDPEMMRAVTELAVRRTAEGGTDEALLAAARSLVTIASQPRRYAAMMAELTGPVLLIGGTRDPIVPLASVRAAAVRNQDWQTVIMEGVGHTPQLERPGALTAVVADWLSRHFPSPDAQE
jgi:pimeloyl-ACP methyl ester carboxylesterase